MASSYTLGAHFDLFVKEQVLTGRYSSSSEVLRDALRLLEDRVKFQEMQLEELRLAIQDGISSGEPIDAKAAITDKKERVRRRQRGSKR